MTEEGIRLLIGLALIVAAHGLAIPYFLNPERHFVKRLRPADGEKIAHGRLLFRSFVGSGLVGGGLHILAWSVGFDIPLSVFSRYWDLAALTAGALIAVGGAGYAYFRLIKYRRLPPDDADAGAFILRKPKRGEKAYWLRTALIIAFFALIAVSLMQLLAPFGR